MTEENRLNPRDFEKNSNVKITGKRLQIPVEPIQIDLQIISSPITIEVPIEAPKVVIKIPSLEEILRRLSGKEGKKYWQIIIHANLLELTAKVFLMNYFAEKGIGGDKWEKYISKLSLGSLVDWLSRLGLIDKKLESKMKKAVEIRNKYVHDLLMMAIFPINSLLEEDLRTLKECIEGINIQQARVLGKK